MKSPPTAHPRGFPSIHTGSSKLQFQPQASRRWSPPPLSSWAQASPSFLPTPAISLPVSRSLAVWSPLVELLPPMLPLSSPGDPTVSTSLSSGSIAPCDTVGWTATRGITGSPLVDSSPLPLSPLRGVPTGSISSLLGSTVHSSTSGGMAAARDLGGQIEGDPSVVAWGPNRLDVFAKGKDSAIWYRWWNGRAWGSWESMGGRMKGSTSTTAWSANRLDLFAVSAQDSSLQHKWWDGSRWNSGWENLGGTLHSDPVAVSWGPNRIDVFTVGAKRDLIHKWWDGRRWAGWESLGGVLESTPVVASDQANRLDVYVIGTDSALWHRYWDGTAWRPWRSLGGTLVSKPAVASWGPDRVDAFAFGTDYAIWHN
ncbi:hypothetical protein QC761_301050 [Podospora bellae-mahoneyi]|uniref:PLL-like beta propeller domain-containing protein n=1 Tax=Podospora bellae-mahoneyi TaxID=2093777 RepID=A0ABR0FJ84_9PEZI|nr:hypothetical protein QC761_301050 [Podospora bellae-mahoneyi]